MHKCDHTGAVDTQQLDNGVDHTFVSAPAGVRRSVREFLFYALKNRYQSAIDMHLRGGYFVFES